MSTAPAFSPGPWTTRSPVVGNFRRWTRDDLYEQCSDQSAAKMPSSVRFGVRPSVSRMLRYSSSVSPCSRASSTVAGASHSCRLHEPAQQAAAVDAAEQLVDPALGVGHQAEHRCLPG